MTPVCMCFNGPSPAQSNHNEKEGGALCKWKHWAYEMSWSVHQTTLSLTRRGNVEDAESSSGLQRNSCKKEISLTVCVIGPTWALSCVWVQEVLLVGALVPDKSFCHIGLLWGALDPHPPEYNVLLETSVRDTLQLCAHSFAANMESALKLGCDS